MRRSPFRPRPGRVWKGFKKTFHPMKRSKINPVSKLKHRLEKRFVPPEIIAEVKKRSGGICESGICERVINGQRCNRPAMKQPHHILMRSRGGKHTLDNLKDLCFIDHTWVHDHPAEATKEGLLK
jgi:hypothetical protein